MMAQFLKLPRMHRSRPDDLPGVSGRARMDRRTKNLTKRLSTGDIAIIDHADLDRVARRRCSGCQVAAVVNAAPSISGRYPNLGPQLLVEAGVPLLDDVGPEVFEQGQRGPVGPARRGHAVRRGRVVAKGTVQTAESVAGGDGRPPRRASPTSSQAFVANTLEYINRDSELLIDGIRAPDLTGPSWTGRHVLVVARGYRHREDLQALRAYIREFKPVMMAVDGGADALLEAGYRPNLIVGDMDSVTDRA